MRKWLISRFALNNTSRVIELASNDGLSASIFRRACVPVFRNRAGGKRRRTRIEKQYPYLVKFLELGTASELVTQGIQANLLVGNNVLAHVPKINDFVEA